MWEVAFMYDGNARQVAARAEADRRNSKGDGKSWAVGKAFPRHSSCYEEN